ncbi:cytochrome P450 [Fodinicola acaciae]|uniref:cytochrome P450 n=1 Tax=Fodinicola acaciae TaxID=2681555 RepID=UPI0013D7886D|nr:cytochrome P450 [Fodinicola acaciae]
MVHQARLPNGLTAWVVGRHADVRAVLTDPRISKDLRNGAAALAAAGMDGFDDGALDMNHADPPEHTRLRSSVMKVFTARRIRELEPRIQQIADDLVDGFVGNTAELVGEYAAPLPVTVISELLGVPAADRPTVRELSTRLFTDAHAGPEAVRNLQAYIGDLLALKRKEPDDALLSALVVQDQLSAAELVSMTFLLLVAGHETTANLIGNAVNATLANPSVRDAVLADPATAVEEFLRFDPPVKMGTFRCAVEDVEIGGVRIRKGEAVIVDLAAASTVSAHPSLAPRPGSPSPPCCAGCRRCAWWPSR